MKPNESIIGIYENLLVNYHEEDITNSNMSNYILETIHTRLTKFPLLFMISSSTSLTQMNLNRPKDEIIFKKFFFNGNSIELEGNYTETPSQFEKMKGYLKLNKENEIFNRAI